jgi:hypothetical protein
LDRKGFVVEQYSLKVSRLEESSIEGIISQEVDPAQSKIYQDLTILLRNVGGGDCKIFLEGIDDGKRISTASMASIGYLCLYG